jgi:RNA polymerase sigma-70 factor (ECF subfamily)
MPDTAPDWNVAGSGQAAARPGAEQTTSLSLLERVRANDAEAWRRLVQLYRPLVLCWCTQRGVNAPDAEDVAQEVFAAAASLNRFHRDRPGDTFRGWLRGIARNQMLLLFRRNQGRPQAAGGSDAWHDLQEVADPLPGPGEEESVEMGRLYAQALELVRGEFEERTWQAFWLTVVEDREPAALAAELGMTPNNIRQAKSRVLRRLREEVGDLLD